MLANEVRFSGFAYHLQLKREGEGDLLKIKAQHGLKSRFYRCLIDVGLAGIMNIVYSLKHQGKYHGYVKNTSTGKAYLYLTRA